MVSFAILACCVWAPAHNTFPFDQMYCNQEETATQGDRECEGQDPQGGKTPQSGKDPLSEGRLGKLNSSIFLANPVLCQCLQHFLCMQQATSRHVAMYIICAFANDLKTLERECDLCDSMFKLIVRLPRRWLGGLVQIFVGKCLWALWRRPFCDRPCRKYHFPVHRQQGLIK